MLNLFETLCIQCQMITDVLGFVNGLSEALCCALLLGLCIIASILRSIQKAVICNTKYGQVWKKEESRAKEEEKKQTAQVLKYLSLFHQDPATSLRLQEIKD